MQRRQQWRNVQRCAPGLFGPAVPVDFPSLLPRTSSLAPQLFMDLGANDDQCDFPVVYASGVKGIAGVTPTEMAEDLQPLFEMVVAKVRGRPPGGGEG